ncbi:PF05284 family protein [Leptospira weilii serovar Topaz str. LT2116]|uniref:PF05284 family protein n=1 Tax=Leptospira weilii serovar Topaz str. LT2116 TaxID=1088540 RepID=M3H4X2_9LEPT|nr:PF05284 family protein [Leptospira weilii serovar Topaz str. LT2116]EMF81386.1 PF05284 family protein [Leptospira weilii serovar Topaz str. LT2116]EMF84136.1 PF05284 family protein [Leptospira weilii serovar Topaz str. LT2116]
MSKLGSMSEEKVDKNGKRFFNLEVCLPFCVKMEFFVVVNSRKNSPDAKDSAPDFLVYHATYQVGAIWKKISRKTSREFLSAEIVAPSFPEGKIKFSLFPDKDQPDKFNVVFSNSEKRPDEVTEEVPY